MRVEVLKPFTGVRPYAVGEQVDATGWRNTRQLVAQRYLRELPEYEAPRGQRGKVANESHHAR